MAVQARFFVAEVHKFAITGGWAAPAPAGKVVMRAASRGEHNKQWASATSSGTFEMTVIGEVLTWFEDRLGREVAIAIDDIPEGEQ